MVRAILCLLLSAGPLSAATISGVVTDADSKIPLGSMIVAAYTAAGSLQSTATTDFGGHYLLALPAGGYRVLAYDATGGYATTFGNDAESFDTSPVVTVGDTIEVNFVLRHAGTITGLVTSVATGRSLPGITVAAYNLSGTRRSFTQSDSRGAYSLALPPGQYKLAAYDEQGSFAVRFFLDRGSFSSATLVSVTAGRPTAGIDFRLELAGHFSGTVVDADSGVILPAMFVIAYNSDGTLAAANTISGPAGIFWLSVPGGTYKLVAGDPLRVFATGYVDDANSFASQTAVAVGSGETRSNLRIPLHRGGTVSGRVTNASGVALQLVTVAAYNGDGSQRVVAQTDSTGAYSILLPPGSYRIAAYDESLLYATQFFPGRNLFISANVVIIDAGQITPAIDFSLIRGVRFTGVVTERTTGLAAPGVSVAVYDSQGNAVSTATTDAAGNYVLVVPPGSYKFVAFDNQLRYVTAYGGGAANYEAATVYEVDGNSVESIDFAVSRGVRVTGKVVDSALLPVSGIQIGALDLIGNRVATAMCNAGFFDLVLTPATYKLLATDPWQRFHPMFYNGGTTLAGATPVLVQNNGVATPITFTLRHADRRRAAPH